MKIYLNSVLALCLLCCLARIQAQPPLEQPVSPDHITAPHRYRPFSTMGQLVDQYIQEKIASGEIDATEYQQLKAQRASLRDEIKALLSSGDQEAIHEKMLELRTRGQQQRQQERDYVKNLAKEDPEMREYIVNLRQRMRWLQLERRRDIIERRLERQQDIRERDHTG